MGVQGGAGGLYGCAFLEESRRADVDNALTTHLFGVGLASFIQLGDGAIQSSGRLPQAERVEDYVRVYHFVAVEVELLAVGA